MDRLTVLLQDDVQGAAGRQFDVVEGDDLTRLHGPLQHAVLEQADRQVIRHSAIFTASPRTL